MTYKVLNVIAGDTFRVSPQWNFQGTQGEIVSVAGIDTPRAGEHGHVETTEVLKQIIENQQVELSNPKMVHSNCLICDVNLNGRKLFS